MQSSDLGYLPSSEFVKNMVNSLVMISPTKPEALENTSVPYIETMVTRLRKMKAASPDIEASAVVSVDGLIIASDLPGEVEEDRVSAMSAAMLSLGERISSELGRGTLEQVYIRGNDGFVILASIGVQAVLTALARQNAKLGLVFLEMRRAAQDLEQFLG